MGARLPLGNACRRARGFAPGFVAAALVEPVEVRAPPLPAEVARDAAGDAGALRAVWGERAAGDVERAAEPLAGAGERDLG